MRRYSANTEMEYKEEVSVKYAKDVPKGYKEKFSQKGLRNLERGKGNGNPGKVKSYLKTAWRKRGRE